MISQTLHFLHVPDILIDTQFWKNLTAIDVATIMVMVIGNWNYPGQGWIFAGWFEVYAQKYARKYFPSANFNSSLATQMKTATFA